MIGHRCLLSVVVGLLAAVQVLGQEYVDPDDDYLWAFKEVRVRTPCILRVDSTCRCCAARPLARHGP
jgi:hypothetical protein